MPTYCAYGTEIKPGVTTNQFYLTAADALEAIASKVPLLAPYLQLIISQIAPRLVDLTAICGRIPPPTPTVDLTTLFTTGQWAAIPAWVADWFWSLWENEEWNTYCQCRVATNPECRYTSDTQVNFTGATAREYARWDPFPVGAATLHIQMTFPNPGGGWALSVRYIRTDGTLGLPIGVGNSSVNPVNVSTTINTNASGFTPRGVAFFIATLGANQTALLNVHTLCEIPGCSSDPPPFIPFVPPPDPPPPDTPPPDEPPGGCTNDQICDFLVSIVQTLQDLTNTVANIQASQTGHIEMDIDTNAWVHSNLPVVIPPDGGGTGPPPPGYQRGPIRGPFSGSGAIAISDLVGVQLGVSQRPEGGLELEGQPPYLWNMGWASILNDDGMLDEKRVTREGQVWLPPNMPLATSVNWTLRPGVELYITELLPL